MIRKGNEYFDISNNDKVHNKNFSKKGGILLPSIQYLYKKDPKKFYEIQFRRQGQSPDRGSTRNFLCHWYQIF